MLDALEKLPHHQQILAPPVCFVIQHVKPFAEVF